MTSKKCWKNLSKEFLKLHRTFSNYRPIKIDGYDFDVFPEVFSPLISSDTQWFIQQLMPMVKNKTFLEIGTGCGIIGCLAKLCGAQEVVVTDINPYAVKNAIHNVEKHHLNIPVLLGDVYDPLPVGSKFEVIFWNHPFNHTEDTSDQDSDLSFSVFDLHYSSLKKYFKYSRNFLENNGILLLGTGNIARINMIKKIASDNNYKMLLIKKDPINLSKFDIAKMDVRLYSCAEMERAIR